MMLHIIIRLARHLSELGKDERGEVNASMISWMVVAALVIFAFRTQLEAMLVSAADFVTATLGI